MLGIEQAGFRENHSTIDHLFSLYGLIDVLLSKRKRLYCAFLDYEKAFDKVDRILPWQKLLEHKIEGKILTVIQNMYATAKSCVMSNNEQSEFFTVHLGVRQGENLSPILFALFLNDMKTFLGTDLAGLGTIIEESRDFNMDESDINNFLKLFLLLYADDTIIFSETPDGLQKGLTKIKEYCDKWKLKLNVGKCKIVIFSRGKVRSFPNFTIGEDVIEVVTSFLYLGLKLNYNNRMNVAHKDLYDRASRAMLALLKKCKTLNLPIDVILDLFEKTILPILTYGCELWGFEQFEALNKHQRKFYKLVLKLRTSTPTLMVFGETGQFPISITIKTRMLCFWFKLISPSNNKLSSTIYKLLLKIHNNSNNTHENSYLKFIRSCLIEVGLPNLWNSQDVVGINFSWFKSHVNQRLKDLFIQDWYSHIDNDSIFTNYRLFKTSFKQEDFLKFLPNDCAITLVRFRTTNNCLPVNTLRYENIDRHDRLCTKCNTNDIGDEYHYLFICPFFKKKRIELLPKFYTKRPNTVKYNDLFNSENKTLLLKLKHFICILNNALRQ